MPQNTGTDQVLYEDHLVCITTQTITFRNYYFPFGTPKSVPFDQIERIEFSKPSIMNGQWRIWGSGNLLTWFPCDWNRPKRDLIFILFKRNARTSIGFTVENSTMAQLTLERQGVAMQPRESYKE